jgi:MtN3 and saliva related transmembrane protein
MLEMNTIADFFGTVAAVTSMIGLIPQIVKTYQTRSAEDISMLMLVNYLVCSLAWIAYGLCIDSLFVAGSNVVGALASSISILQKKIYDTRQSA